MKEYPQYRYFVNISYNLVWRVNTTTNKIFFWISNLNEWIHATYKITDLLQWPIREWTRAEVKRKYPKMFQKS